MARSLDRSASFRGAGSALVNMMLFLGVVGAILYVLSPWGPNEDSVLTESFAANPYLNGLILAVLGLGVVYNLRQAMVVGPAVRWVRSFRNASDPDRMRLPGAPSLISAAERMLLDADRRGGALSQASTRAILDSVGVRIDEGREFGRYAANLLVFLGLLGTFFGLLQTVNGIADVIGNLSESASTGEDAVGQLIANLNEPLSGMGTAFSSSLFGLGGSLVLGFLDIQAGRAQNQFYTDLEDWLSGITETTTASGTGSRQSLGGDVATRLEQALKGLEASQDRGAAAVRQEIRDLGRLLTGAARGDRG